MPTGRKFSKQITLQNSTNITIIVGHAIVEKNYLYFEHIA